MNAKFRMPKFGRDVKWLAMLKELLMTVFATTVSIILTFGTAHYVDGKAKKAAGRQTAMMVIHDMEKSIEALRDWGKEDATNSEIARYVMENLDRIDSLSLDTLGSVVNYITNNSDEMLQYQLDESCERLFLSSQESWKNIDNASFIDAVHQFFSDRHVIFDYLNTSRQWKKPVSSEAFYQHQLEREDGTTDYFDFLKERITSKEVIYYLNYAEGRRWQINGFADEIQHISDQCKFTMGITDEELEEYVKARERMGRNVKEKELVGQWIIQSTSDKYSSMVFHDNHTYSQTHTELHAHPYYTGRIDVTFTSNGTWELRGDTLYTDRQHDCTFSMDRSQITPKPDMEKQVEEYVKELEGQCLDTQKAAREAEDQTTAYFATINRSGNKIELVRNKAEEVQTDQERLFYLPREK